MMECVVSLFLEQFTTKKSLACLCAVAWGSFILYLPNNKKGKFHKMWLPPALDSIEVYSRSIIIWADINLRLHFRCNSVYEVLRVVKLNLQKQYPTKKCRRLPSRKLENSIEKNIIFLQSTAYLSLCLIGSYWITATEELFLYS